MSLVIEDECSDVLDFGGLDYDIIMVRITDRSVNGVPCVIINKSQAIQIIKHLTEQFTITEKELTT